MICANTDQYVNTFSAIKKEQKKKKKKEKKGKNSVTGLITDIAMFD